MAGIDNGTLQSGIFAQAKQFGSILRGLGPPVPQAGVAADLYIDTQTWQLFEKRGEELDPWGHYLFVVPSTYRTSLKWFSAFAPGDDVGVTGDYCLAWAGYANYGMQPSIYGPKLAGGWPENGNGPNQSIAALGAGTVLPVGLSDEGTPITYSTSTQLIVVGLQDEYILAIPTVASAGDPVAQLGLPSGPAAVAVTLNPLYTAEDELSVPGTVGTARLPAAAASVAILSTDIEVGINTGSAATVCPLPSVAAWAAANPNGLELTIFDLTGSAATNNVTFTLNGTDVFTQGVSPAILNSYGEVKLRPILTGGINQWFVRGAG